MTQVFSRELALRIVTAVVGVSALVGLLVYGDLLGARILGYGLALGMIWEYSRMTLSLPDRSEKTALLIILVTLIHLFALTWIGIICGLLILFTYYLFSARRYGGSTLLTHLQEMAFSFFGFVYLGCLTLYLPFIRSVGPEGLHWVLLFLVIVWSGDTGAYFVGKKLGRHKLYPLISPKKSVEGAIGSIGCSWVLAYGYCRVFFPEFSDYIQLSEFSILVVTVNIVSQIGDLCESFLKRAFDKKDSGSILPGHGGFLDRFDSVVLALPAMAMGLNWLI